MFTRIFRLIKLVGLALSISERGVLSPILVSRSGVVLDGNTRLRLAKILGLSQIPYVRIDADVEYGDPNGFEEVY